MKFKKILSIILASIFIISQSAVAANKESGQNKNKDTSNNLINYTKYPKAINPTDSVNIPDSRLKAAINKTLGASRKEDQDITKAEMESLTDLVNTFNDGTQYIISDLTGLEYAINLESLIIFGDSKNKLGLKNVDIVQNLSSLTHLLINDYNLSTINVSKNVNLKFLVLFNNSLSTIDLSKNVNLSSINLSNNNNLSTIDLSKNTNLRILHLSNNNLSTIDLSNNTDLTELFINNNNLSTIDLSKNINLVRLNISNNNLSSIDRSKNTKLNLFLANDQNIQANLDDVNLQDDKVIIKNKVQFNGSQIGNITGTGVSYDPNTNLVTIDNPNKDKFVSYSFDNNFEFSGKVTANLSATGVTLSPTNSIIKIGETQQLTATVTPNAAIDKNIKWSSSDKNVATVDQNGLVKAVGVGKTTITVTTNDGGFTATSTITVNPIKVTNIVLSSTNSTIEIGRTEKLTATVTPDNATDKSVTWSSSDKNVATVDQNGLVTAVGVGIATITVTTNDGGHKAISIITVTPIKVTNIVLSSTNSTIKIGETEQLNVTIIPDNAMDKSVTWSSSDESVATVDQNGLVTAVGAGTATITVTTNDGGFTSSSIITVNSTNQDLNNNTGMGNTTNPQTGVAGLYSILAVAGLGLCSAFASKKRKNK